LTLLGISRYLSPMVKRRYVFHIAGYDPIGAAWYRLFKRELAKFAQLWNVRPTLSDLERSSKGADVRWRVATSAANWQVETVYEPLLWDDIVLSDFARPTRERVSKSPLAFLDIVWSGAVFRYFKANWQYALFFFFPYVLVCAFALVAAAIAYWVADFTTLAPIPRIALAGVLAVVLFIALLYWPGRRWRVQQALDDWIFSWDYVYDRRPDLDARLDRFAEAVIARSREAEWDEIVIVGHSMGATLLLEVVTRALARDPDLGRHGPAVCVLTVGSTIPKFTLHPAGKRFRRYAAALVKEPSIAWAEYHARSDAISFYKFDPVTLTRFYGDPIRGKPLMRRVRLQHMLERSTYWRFRLRFMRLHYQFIMANERRTTYDYFMMVCGPVPFARMVLAPAGAAELIAADGSLIDPDAPMPTMPPAAQLPCSSHD
jgi:pimeloyl-ACP methyl ester carboxylesterase